MRPLPPADQRALVPVRITDHERRIARIEREAYGLPRCRATRTANLSITTSGTPQFVTMPTEDFDTHAFHDTSTNTERLTIPAGMAGDYSVTANVVFASNATGNRQLFIQKNEAGINDEGSGTNAVSGNVTRLSQTVAVSLAAGDRVRVMVNQTSGGALNVTSASLQLFKIG